jgi:hypothetical protein
MSKRNMTGTKLAAASGAALLGLLSIIHYSLPRDAPDVLVEEPDRVIGDVVPEQECNVTFRVHNRSPVAVRVVGTEFT